MAVSLFRRKRPYTYSFSYSLCVCVHIGMNVYLIILRLEDNNRGMCWRTRQQQFHRRRSSVAWRIQDHYIFIFQSHTSRGYERRERMYTFIFPRMGKEKKKRQSIHITRVYIKCLAIKDERVKSSWSIGESRGGSRCREIFNCGKITFFLSSSSRCCIYAHRKADNITHNTGGILSSAGICISTSSGSTR